jgi:hypothetical protein
MDYRKRFLNLNVGNANEHIQTAGIDIIQAIIEAELTLLFLKNYKLNIFKNYYTRYIENHFIDWKTDSYTVNKDYRKKYKKDRYNTYSSLYAMIFKLSQDSKLQEKIREKLNYIGRKDGKFYKTLKYNIQFINSPRGTPAEIEWLRFMKWWNEYWPYGHNLDEMAETYQNIQ